LIKLSELVFTDYQLFKEVHFDVYQKFTKREVRPLREADIICVLPFHKCVEGWLKTPNGAYKNLLVSNFFSLLFGTINKVNMVYMDTYGLIGSDSGTLRTSGDVNYGSAYLAFGTGTGETGFSSYILQNRNTALEGAVASPSLIISQSEGRSRLARATAGTVYEVGIYQGVYRQDGGTRTAMWGRVVPSSPIPTGYTVLYDIIFKPPFTHNMTRIIHALLTESAVDGGVDIAGATFAFNANTVSGGATRRLFLGTNTSGLDHTIVVPTNPYEIDNWYAFGYSYGSYYNHFVVGAKKLDVDIDIAELFLVGPFQDSAGGVRNCAIVRWPISPPVSKKAGEYVSAYVLLYASA
jgi:hypothetical protein